MTKKENRPGAGDANGTANNAVSSYSTASVSAGQDNMLLDVPTRYDGRKKLLDSCRDQEIPYDDLLRYAAIACFEKYKGWGSYDAEEYGRIKHDVVELTNDCVKAYNEGPADPHATKDSERFPDEKKGAARYKHISAMHPLQIAIAILVFDHAKCIECGTVGDDDNYVIGVYQFFGPKAGTYDVSDAAVMHRIHRYDSGIKKKDVEEVVDKLRVICPYVAPCDDPDLIAVNNGIFDYGNKMLFDFDPELVFLSKSRVDFVEGAKNPVIVNPDGTTWDVVSWVHSLTDDPAVENLLWQLVGAVIRPNVRWNKTPWLYSTMGNNGKGTFCTLLRNLCGPNAWASIPLSDFGKQFMLEPLMHVSAVITDENDTGTFVGNGSVLKSVVTGDPVRIDRKYKDPIDVRFHGLVVQCVNELPNFRDTTESLYRRVLAIPFDKRFEGHERKYIKDDYLYRKEVLEYVLYRVLMETDYYEFDVPAACADLLDEFRVSNDPIRQFADEIFPAATWTLMPCDFLYDLYRHWFQRNMPSGKPIGKNKFLKNVEPLALERGWKRTDKYVRSAGRMDKPEPLILQYDVTEWMDKTYRGTDPGRLCMPDIKKRYRGFVRLGSAPSGGSGPDSNPDDTPDGDAPVSASDAEDAAKTAADCTPANPTPAGDAVGDAGEAPSAGTGSAKRADTPPSAPVRGLPPQDAVSAATGPSNRSGADPGGAAGGDAGADNDSSSSNYDNDKE